MKKDLGMALVTYKQYSQQKSCENIEPKTTVPSQYQKIIDKYPGILEVKVLKKPLHGVVHSIDTKDHPPCKAGVRPLMANTKRAKEVKQTWDELERLGVVENL